MERRILWLLLPILLLWGLALGQAPAPSPVIEDPTTWRLFWASVPALALLVNLVVAGVRPVIGEEFFKYRGGLLGLLLAIVVGGILGVVGHLVAWLVADDWNDALVFGLTAGLVAAGGWNIVWKYVLAFIASFKEQAEARQMEAEAKLIEAQSNATLNAAQAASVEARVEETRQRAAQNGGVTNHYPNDGGGPGGGGI